MPSKKEKGDWGELVACDLFTAQGWGILEQNWRMGHYEIDLILHKGQTIVFVEVKTRTSSEIDPIDAVDKRKRAHLIASADAYLKHYDLPYDFRFDIVGITGTPESYEVEHIPDAFYPAPRKFNYIFKL